MKQFADLRLYEAEEIEAATFAPSDFDAAIFTTIVAWGRAFLNTENADLGRDGPVCPFTKSSMQKQLFFVAQPLVGGDLNGIEATVIRYRALYDELSAELDEKKRNLLTFLLPLPDFDIADPAALDELQGRLKADFVKDGLMIGQFHPACDQAGLWNADFRPLRSPIPLLAIRVMVLYDLPFLIEDEHHLDAYLANFAREIPPRVRAQLLGRLFAPRP